EDADAQRGADRRRLRLIERGDGADEALGRGLIAAEEHLEEQLTGAVQLGVAEVKIELFGAPAREHEVERVEAGVAERAVAAPEGGERLGRHRVRQSTDEGQVIAPEEVRAVGSELDRELTPVQRCVPSTGAPSAPGRGDKSRAKEADQSKAGG